MGWSEQRFDLRKVISLLVLENGGMVNEVARNWIIWPATLLLSFGSRLDSIV